jgi:hypothetical protein
MMAVKIIITAPKKMMIVFRYVPVFIAGIETLGGIVKPMNQVQTDHTIMDFPFTRTRCFMGYTTTKKRSSEMDTIMRNDTLLADIQTNWKIQYVSSGTLVEKFANKLVKRSEIAKFSTRYVPEFLKHFSGSFINAIMRSAFETTPKAQTVRGNMLTSPALKPDEVTSVMLSSQ